MFFFFLLSASSPFSFLHGIPEQVLAGLAVLLVSAAVTSYTKRRRQAKEDKAKEDKTVLTEISALKTLTMSMHTALVGSDDPLNPSEGALKTIADMGARTTKIEHTLFANGGRQNTILDRLGRIENAANTGTESVQRVETAQEAIRKDKDEAQP